VAALVFAVVSLTAIGYLVVFWILGQDYVQKRSES